MDIKEELKASINDVSPHIQSATIEKIDQSGYMSLITKDGKKLSIEYNPHRGYKVFSHFFQILQKTS